MMTMRILVTGGAGFIGSHFVRLLLEFLAGIRRPNRDCDYDFRRAALTQRFHRRAHRRARRQAVVN